MPKPSPKQKLELLVWQWKVAPVSERKEIVRAAYIIARGEGIAYLSWQLHIPQSELRKIGRIDENFRREVNRARRGRGPSPQQKWLAKEYAAITAHVTGWGGEDRRGRRNTLSSTTKRRAARYKSATPRS